MEAICNFSQPRVLSEFRVKFDLFCFGDFWYLKMADDGTVSDGSDIDYEDSEIGSNT